MLQALSNSLHVTESFIKIVLFLEKDIKYIVMLNHMMTVLLEYIDHLLQFSINA